MQGMLHMKQIFNDVTMNHETAPLISIIVAVYNGKATLQQCIDSVVQQTYPNKELIIIDGGSIDGTVELLEENRNKFSYWVSEPDRGIYNAWNKGLAQAQGEWIYFLGADDYFWNEKVLDRLSEKLKNLPADIRVAYGQVMIVNTNGTNLYLQGEPWAKIKTRFRKIMCIPHQGVLHRRCIFERHGQFDESFCIAGDYELLLNELKEGDAIFFQDTIIAAQRLGGISSNTENYFKTLQEYRRAQKIHGLHMPGSYFLKEVAIEYFRRLLWKVLGEQMAKKLLDLRRRSRGLPPYWTKT